MLDDSVLKVKYPNLFQIEEDKFCNVSDLLFMDDGICSVLWQWRRPIELVNEFLELTELNNKLAGLQLSEDRDDWQWHGSNDGFSVAAIKSWLSKTTTESSSPGFKWVKWIPIKCNIFMWRALMERIPTKDALVRRHIHVADTGCLLCNDADESAVHIFTACAFAPGIWQVISRWCGIPNVFAFDTKDLLDIADNCGRSPMYKEVIKGIIIIVCWRIWKAPNELLFRGIRTKGVEIIADVKAYGFLWYKHRENIVILIGMHGVTSL